MLGAGDDKVTYFDTLATGNNTVDINFGEGNNSFLSPFRTTIGNSNITLTFGTGDDVAGNDDGINISGGNFSADLGDGNNTARIYNGYVINIVAGAGIDNIATFATILSIETGAGADSLDVWGAGSVSTGEGDDTVHAGGTLSLTTGDGNDTAYISDSVIADFGSDNDVVHLSLQDGASTITVGTGADKLVIDTWNGTTSTTVTDFTAGAGGETLDYNALLNQLIGWDGSSNPFGSGFMQLVQDGADTLFQIDRDGGASAQTYATLIRFQNTNAADFTAANFNPAYPTDGSGISGVALNGNSVVGTIGDDTITGTSGNDVLNGANGSDRVIGDAGDDTLTGGFGADTFVFAPGFGMDVITDFTTLSTAHDVIELAQTLFADFSAVQSAAEQVGSDVVITYDESDTITLSNVQWAQLGIGDFVFV